LFRPSTWQVACVLLVGRLVGFVKRLGESRRLPMSMLLVISLLQ
jgi:hypothetical protein